MRTAQQVLQIVYICIQSVGGPSGCCGRANWSESTRMSQVPLPLCFHRLLVAEDEWLRLRRVPIYIHTVYPHFLHNFPDIHPWVSSISPSSYLDAFARIYTITFERKIYHIFSFTRKIRKILNQKYWFNIPFFPSQLKRKIKCDIVGISKNSWANKKVKKSLLAFDSDYTLGPRGLKGQHTASSVFHGRDSGRSTHIFSFFLVPYLLYFFTWGSQQ